MNFRMLKQSKRIIVTTVVLASLVFGCTKKPEPDCWDKGKAVVCPQAIAILKDEIACSDPVDNTIHLLSGELFRYNFPTHSATVSGVKVTRHGTVEESSPLKDFISLSLPQGAYTFKAVNVCSGVSEI